MLPLRHPPPPVAKEEEMGELEQVTKVCTKCGRELPATREFFYRDKSGKNGLRGSCKECDQERGRQRKEKGPVFPPSPGDVKICSRCKGELPATEEYFGKSGRSMDGLRYSCKQCELEFEIKYRELYPEKARASWQRYQKENPEKVQEAQKRYREANREKTREASRKWAKEHPEMMRAKNRRWAKNHPDEIRELNRQWRAANREKERERGRRKYAANPEKAKEATRRWEIAHPEQKQMCVRRHRARKLNAEGSHTGEDTQRQYDSQHGRCWWCGWKLGPKWNPGEKNAIRRRGKIINWTEDHRIPLTRGGTDWPNNIVIACLDCNFRKHDKTPAEFAGRLL